MNGEINAPAWSLWFLAVVVLPLTSRNPLYLGLLLLIVMVVFLTLPDRSGRSNPWRFFAYIGSVVAVLSIAFNVLTVHVGDRVFATLPSWLPVIGGPLTINALAYGAISAAAISAVLFSAATFNSAVRHADLVRMLPGSLSRFGVAAGIALLFVPQTINAARDIYDAQRARGHYFRGVRDARAFIVPLLATGLERALLLSEALETRGFGSSAAAVRVPPARHLWLAGAAASMVVALFALGSGLYGPGIGAMFAAGVLVLGSSSSTQRRSRYRPTVWNTPSLIVAATATCAAVTLLAGRAVIEMHIAFDTFPRIDHPGFAPVAGIALLLLIAPALVRTP